MKKISYIILTIAICLAVSAADSLSQEELIEESSIFVGKIANVDVENSTITVVNEEGDSLKLLVDKEFTTIWKGDGLVEFTDLKNNETVELEYHKEDEGLFADWIELSDYLEDMSLPEIEELEEYIEEDIFQEEEDRAGGEAVEKVE